MAFEACRGDEQVACNSDGSDFEITSCPFGCSESLQACHQCRPDKSTCNGATVNQCGPDGLPASSEVCKLGCTDLPTPHCTYLAPKYLPDICDAAAGLDILRISSSGTFDTNLDSNCTGGVVTQTGGPEICVVRYGTISLEQGGALTVTGARALALVADHDVSIRGYLDLSAEGFDSGPGGGTIRSGALGSTPNGGGGAGFKTAGGAGGSATLNGGAGNGGASSPDPAAFTVLLGGPQTGPDGLFIGGGGGAATLVSCRGTVDVAGEINAAGGGGAGGAFFLTAPLGGAGGGAGGYVVLQGLAVTVTGKLFANGGGGGAGMRSNQTTGTHGSEGERSSIAASGGAASTGEGVGGNGGTDNATPVSGGRLNTAGTSAGGGGGSVGFFQSYTPAGVAATLTPSAASPLPQPNGTIPTR